MGCHRLCNRHTYRVVYHARWLRFCIQNRIKLVDFCPGWFAGVGNCATDGELAKLEAQRGAVEALRYE